MDNQKLCVHKRRGCTICQFKTNTSLEEFVWFYALINGVSARGDIYSSSEVWVGKNVIFLQAAAELFVIFYSFFKVLKN